jgi:nucleotide-binding universal stress UspA family protein
MYKKILIPLDNSPADKAILEHIQPLAKLMKPTLVLIHVADGYGARFQKQLNLQDSEEIKQDSKYLESVKETLLQQGFTVITHLGRGEPSSYILRIAKRESCDLIAMATHGHRFIKDLILGSVAENIRHRTDIPILMVRAHPTIKK